MSLAAKSKTANSIAETAVYRKVTWRFMPILFLCYILNYLDRVNVGFGKLQMQQQLHLTDAVYGLAAGIFFLSYITFQVPSNIALQKIGARRWIGPIMILWGMVSASTMFVNGARSFYALRLLLGFVESGFFPGVILYLTFWYTRKQRARIIAIFMSAIALSGFIGGPISGWILETISGVHFMAGWRWMFLLEGLPSIAMGLTLIFFLDDGPATARWLSSEEKDVLLRELAEEEVRKRQEGHHRHSLRDAFHSSKVWLLCFVYMGLVIGNYGLSFWLPQILKDTITQDPWRIGLLSMIPWGAGAAAMIWWGHHSDRTTERRWHLAASAILGSIGFAVSGIRGISGYAGLVALTVATVGVMSAMSISWTLPTSILSGGAAAAGIAWINSVAHIGAFACPYIIGWIRDTTGKMVLALLFLSAACLASATIALYVARPPRKAI